MAISKEKIRFYVCIGVGICAVSAINRLADTDFQVNTNFIIYILIKWALTVLVLFLIAKFTGIGNWDAEKKHYVITGKPE